MPSARFWPAIAALLLLVPAILGRGAEPQPPTDPPAGELLVASAAIEDPRFQHSVVLLLRHDGTGAFGIVINHPLTERPLADLLADTGSKDRTDTPVEGTIRVFLGGPVQPEYGFVIHSTDYHRAETLVVSDELAMTANTEVLRDIGHHRGPAKFLFALGYAGWGAGQLEGEIAQHGWFTAPANSDLVFDTDRAMVWEKALARRTREL